MLYSNNPPFIFVHIPKTAGTSIEEAFYQYQDFWIDDNNIHTPMVQFKEHLTRQQFDEAFKFCFVRNPFDLMYSTWKYWVHNNGLEVPFEEWIIWRYEGRMSDGFKFVPDSLADGDSEKIGHLGIAWYMNRTPQSYYFVGERGEFLPDFIGCFEFLKEDYDTIVKHLNLVDVYLPHANKNRDKSDSDYRKYYTERTRKIVEEMYALDFAIFGYSFDEMVPDHSRFGFVDPTKNTIKHFGGENKIEYFINHAALPYDFQHNLKRHAPKDDFERQLKDFETNRLHMRQRSLHSNLNKISHSIYELENELMNCEDETRVIELQSLIIGEREIELMFKIKSNKIQKEINNR